MNEVHVYVNMPEYEQSFSSIGEAFHAIRGQGEFASKAYPAPSENVPPVTIHIGPGIYREKLVLDRPYVTLVGAGQGRTVVIFGDYANDILDNGEKRGTFRTATFRIDTHDICIRHMTIQNDAGYGHTVGQALAMYADGDRICFEDCALIGSQDTLFTAPLPQKEAQPGGFAGPGEAKPRVMGRQYYHNCYLQGDVDFIFGGAVALFDHCRIYSKKPGDRKPSESPSQETILGYVTAASTPKDQPYGYVFRECIFDSDCPIGTVYLGRPWREYAKTVLLHCTLGAHIHLCGWQDWGKPHGHFLYAEYDNVGPGASPETRADFSVQLSKEDATVYTTEEILEGWHPPCNQLGPQRLIL
jgi:pectinesterase